MQTVAVKGAGTVFQAFNPDMVDLSSPDMATLGGITIYSPGIAVELQEACVKEAMRVLEEHGSAAFDLPKETAAIHEAGHIVIGRLIGKRLKGAKIRQHKSGNWIGVTNSHPEPHSLDTPDKILREARSIYAGIAAEMLFDPDPRRGSSIDEVVMSQLITADASRMLGVDDPRTYWVNEVHYAVGAELRCREKTVRKIASYLVRNHQIRQPTLNRLTAACLAAIGADEVN